MSSWRYDYVDGTLKGVGDAAHERIGFEISKLYDTHILVSKKNSVSVKIPWEHVVEMQHFTVDPKKKSGKKWLVGAAIGAGIMLTPLGPIIAGAKLVAMGAATAGTLALAGITVGGGIGTIWGIRDNIMSKVTKNNCFMISYLEKDDPKNLKVLIFEHGNTFIKNAIQFFSELMEKDKGIQKADFVVACQQKLAEAVAQAEAEAIKAKDVHLVSNTNAPKNGSKEDFIFVDGSWTGSKGDYVTVAYNGCKIVNVTAPVEWADELVPLLEKQAFCTVQGIDKTDDVVTVSVKNTNFTEDTFAGALRSFVERMNSSSADAEQKKQVLVEVGDEGSIIIYKKKYQNHLAIPMQHIVGLEFVAKEKKLHHFIISYLDESAPDELKVITLNANTTFGNAFVKKTQEFSEQLMSVERQTVKADFVLAFQK